MVKLTFVIEHISEIEPTTFIVEAETEALALEFARLVNESAVLTNTQIIAIIDEELPF